MEMNNSQRTQVTKYLDPIDIFGQHDHAPISVRDHAPISNCTVSSSVLVQDSKCHPEYCFATL